MKRISYLTNKHGGKTAVVFDLKKYKEELEDFIDGLKAASRVNEPAVDFEKAVDKIIKSKSSAVSRHSKKVGQKELAGLPLKAVVELKQKNPGIRF